MATKDHDRIPLAMDAINDPETNVTDMVRHVLSLHITLTNGVVDWADQTEKNRLGAVLLKDRVDDLESKDKRFIGLIAGVSAVIGAALGNLGEVKDFFVSLFT